jgi:2-polyprenyl-3-methyl-5-hydroxy-6-metoxy-1,4-benzoquinol methylase
LGLGKKRRESTADAAGLSRAVELNSRPESSATTPPSNGRFPKIEGLDYKRGAQEYARRLDASNRHHLLTKPFYNLANKISKYAGEGMDADTHRHFCDFANMAVTLAMPVGARLLDVGCGSGWLCEYFARLGYDATGIDISADLIALARERLERVPYELDDETRLRYRFLEHDIENAALPEIFDVVICYDSLHHFEDERAVLRNISEMLEEGGFLFVLEGERPPAGSETENELRDVMWQYETLESPFSRDYLLRLLREHGFAIVGDFVSVNGLFERELIEGQALPIEQPAVNYLLCKKVSPLTALETVVPDSRAPGVLRARINIQGEWTERVRAGEQLQVAFEVENTGDTLWLVSRAALKGTIRLGVKILDEAGATIDEIHGRPPLPRALAPGERVSLMLAHPAPTAPGSYTLKIDFISQDICWFEQHGSQPLALPFRVSTDNA